MSIDVSALCGWLENDAPEAVAEYRERCAADGETFGFSAAQPALLGFWKRIKSRGGMGVFLQDAETELFGTLQPSFSQNRGTCVAQSGARCQQDTIYGAIVRGEVARGVRISVEVAYGISRVSVGKRALRGGDGSTGAWQYRGVHDFGCVMRGKYGTIDLTEPREDLAVQWGDNGVPASLLAEASGHKVSACHFCESVEDIADAIAARYAVQLCCGKLRGMPNRDGISMSERNGAHATELCGVFIDNVGQDCFVEQNSWGGHFGPPATLRYAGGTKNLRQGSYGVRMDDIASCLQRGGEAWACSIPDNLPRPGSVGDIP